MDRYVLHDVLREYLPLKQGLRQELSEVFVVTEDSESIFH